MKITVGWFEIPVADMERARRFYETVLGVSITVQDMPPWTMGLIPHSPEGGAIGALFHGEKYTPSADGPVVYITAGEDLSEPLSRVEAAGGRVLVPKKAIGENGFIAWFSDTEGNRLAFHSVR